MLAEGTELKQAMMSKYTYLLAGEQTAVTCISPSSQVVFLHLKRPASYYSLSNIHTVYTILSFVKRYRSRCMLRKAESTQVHCTLFQLHAVEK